ncbi:MAG: Rossmann-like and DUF2520 domain-containing protein [Phycisphaerae bacterium]
MKRTSDIAIVGPGKVGTALGVLALRAGWSVGGVAGGGPGRAAAAAGTIGSTRDGSPVDVASSARLVLLTVPDDAIRRVCDDLSSAGAFDDGVVVAHCSGALGSEELSSAQACGASVGSMHPLQTFPSVQAAVEKLPGAFFFMEGDETAIKTLESLASAIGGRCVRIASQAKGLYHAAAVLACNYLTALLDAALSTDERAGIDRAQASEALEPLMRATLENACKMGTEQALTGPIVRGDVETVRRHLGGLAGCEQEEVYRTLGVYTVGLAERSGRLPAGEAEQMRRLLRREKE